MIFVATLVNIIDIDGSRKQCMGLLTLMALLCTGLFLDELYNNELVFVLSFYLQAATLM